MSRKRHNRYGQNPNLRPENPVAGVGVEHASSEVTDDRPTTTPVYATTPAPEPKERPMQSMIAPVPERDLLSEPEDVTPEDDEEIEEPSTPKKKIQNLTAAVIVLAGLFVGSLFVDVAQLFSRDGLSALAVKRSDVLTAGGKTWVAFADPKVAIQVVTDDSCEACSPDETLVWMRRILPTIEAEPIQAKSEEGKRLIETMGITGLPAFVFGSSIKDTDFYSLASQIFSEKDGRYLLDTAQLGLAPGKYLRLPEVRDDDLVIGNRDAKVKIVEFLDFQCPYCRAFHPSVNAALDEYGDRIAFVIKHLPLGFHPQAQNAAIAAECANEQGMLREYVDLLFEKQPVWGNTTGTAAFETYARQMRLNGNQFSVCMASGKYDDKISATMDEAASFGVNGTPGTFVGDAFITGAVSYDKLKVSIDEALAK